MRQTEDMVGGYRPGVGRSWLAWYFGPEEAGREEVTEAFSNGRPARKWVEQQARNDYELGIFITGVTWEARPEDGGFNLTVLTAEDSKSTNEGAAT